MIILVKSTALAWVLVFMTGLAVANIWPLVFSIAVEKYPARSNEISGLMLMAISGGAVIPLLVGLASDKSDVAAGMAILLAGMVYLWAVALYCMKRIN
jgi:fucose permease